MHSQEPPGVVQNWSTLQCSKQNTEQCGYDHAPVTRGRMRAQFPLPHGPHFLSVYFFSTLSGCLFFFECLFFFDFQHLMDHASQVDARIVSNSLTTPTLRQPLPDNGGPLADSPKSIPRSIDRRWRMIPGDGRIVGKANAKADNRPHADLLPQKSSDKIPNFMLQFG